MVGRNDSDPGIKFRPKADNLYRSSEAALSTLTFSSRFPVTHPKNWRGSFLYHSTGLRSRERLPSIFSAKRNNVAMMASPAKTRFKPSI
jgi:hypothetical protein